MNMLTRRRIHSLIIDEARKLTRYSARTVATTNNNSHHGLSPRPSFPMASPSLWTDSIHGGIQCYPCYRYHYHHFSTKASQSPTADTGKISARPQGEKESAKGGIAESSSSSSSASSSEFALPDKDKEQELSRLQVEIQDRYRSGDYRRALEASRDLQKETEDHFGRDHPATASTYNNVGLMSKQLGDFDESRKSYQAALKIYKKTVGADHASYASILHNLGNLNRSQIHFDSSLRATDRLTLIEQAASYLEQAWRIRVEEMGEDHPHTVASLSSWGSTIATQILHHHKASSSPSTTSGSSSSASTNKTSGQRPYISLLSKDVTQQAWDAAEAHLRKALQTSIDKPRGPSLPKPKGKKGAKKTKKEDTNSSSSNSNMIQTLSAASAAQNLAIFLKTRATTETPYNDEWLAEAKQLYTDAMTVRIKLLPEGHPDLYATRFSYSELLETMGDQEAANAVRQQIIDTYDPVEGKDQSTNEETASEAKS